MQEADTFIYGLRRDGRQPLRELAVWDRWLGVVTGARRELKGKEPGMPVPNEREKKGGTYFAGRFWREGRPGQSKGSASVDTKESREAEQERLRREREKNGAPSMEGMF